MKIFLSIKDLQQLDFQNQAYAVIKKHLEHMADLYPDSGYLVLLDSQQDFEAPLLNLTEIKRPLLEIIQLSEGCIKQDGYFKLFYATNNSFGICLFIEDSEWLTEGLRRALEDAEI